MGRCVEQKELDLERHAVLEPVLKASPLQQVLYVAAELVSQSAPMEQTAALVVVVAASQSGLNASLVLNAGLVQE